MAENFLTEMIFRETGVCFAIGLCIVRGSVTGFIHFVFLAGRFRVYVQDKVDSLCVVNRVSDMSITMKDHQQFVSLFEFHLPKRLTGSVRR